jgi:hypothetical protein
MSTFPGLSQAVGPAANDDFYGVAAYLAGKQAVVLEQFIDQEVARLIDEIWPGSCFREAKQPDAKVCDLALARSSKPRARRERYDSSRT